MRNQEEKTKLKKTSVAKRSIFLFLIAVPMIYIASLGKNNIACMVLSVIYVIALFINGITGIPIILKLFIKDSTLKKWSVNINRSNFAVESFVYNLK